MNRPRRSGATVLAATLCVGLSSCDGLSTGPRNVVAPIELTATGFADPTNSGGYRVVTDYCDCES